MNDDLLVAAIMRFTDATTISDLGAIRAASTAGAAPDPGPEVEAQPDPGFDAMDPEELARWAEANRLVLPTLGDGGADVTHVPGLLRGLAARGELESPDGVEAPLARAAAPTTPINRDAVHYLLDHGAQVRCFSGSDHSQTHAQGRMVAYTDKPMVLVADEVTGKRTWWVAEIAEVLSVPVLSSHELPELPPDPAKRA